MQRSSLLRPLALVLTLAAPFGRADELKIAAAASLAESITEIGKLYQDGHPGTTITPVFAGSNVLARQIESGAPVDVFISADEKTMDGLVKNNHVTKEAVVPLLSNALVVVAPTDATFTVQSAADLAKLQRISIADPAAVPAGVYAKTWLTGRGLWDQIQPKTVGAENVRGALAAVEAGNADAAIVYRTDAAVSQKVKIVFTAPSNEAPAIVYPAAVVRESKHAEESKQFVAFLRGDKAAEVFKKRGFTVLPPTTK
ncbi:molybdate ABC transporter substrate-binding protein [Luteolibacter ambystomatis]|uniref:Molybdate ABC transporter substrate-binding protein n=1 Tax=Luteolibacter ambystomatis TaxID=2824561 RepID=A0A975G8M9_9BACT|nr:molybdate ABC transporter substrate-binding protein [Luteolibacter ambystomatis]QUE51372.1 molybdate ABC transporter substrate-binding protein [Luteolibacter ambystomatis]